MSTGPGAFRSLRNHTTDALADGAEWLGAGEPVTEAGVMISVITDVACTVRMEFSNDGTNWDSGLSYQTVPNFHEFQTLLLGGRWFRLRITNDSGAAMTYLRAWSFFGNFAQQPTSPLNSTIGVDAPAVIARTISDEISIREGAFAGHGIVNKFGTNGDIDSGSVPEDVWENGGTYTGFPDGAETVEVFSSAAADTAAGTGARTVRMVGLDQDYNVAAETVTLNGTTGVLTTTTFRRVHTCRVVTAGSGGVNAGTITLRQSTTTSAVFATIVPGRNQSNVAAYTIPAGRTGYMRRLHSSTRRSASTLINGFIWTRIGDGTDDAVFRSRRPFSVSGGDRLDDKIFGGLPFSEKSDIVIRIDFASANNIVVTAGFDLILVDD